jgi:hypothetical protein
MSKKNLAAPLTLPHGTPVGNHLPRRNKSETDGKNTIGIKNFSIIFIYIDI